MDDQRNHRFPPEPTGPPGYPDQYGAAGQQFAPPVGQPVEQPAPRRSRGRVVLTAVVGLVAALVGAGVIRAVTDDSPTKKDEKPRELVSPDVPAGFSLVRDDTKGYAMIVPKSYEDFDFSQENIAALQKAAESNPKLAGLAEQFTSSTDKRPTMFRIDYETGDNINLIATDASPHGVLPVGLDKTAASALKEQLGVTITETAKPTIDGRRCLMLSYRLPDADIPGGLPGTQVYVPGADHLYIVTVTSMELDPADLDRIVGSLRVA